MPKIGEAWIERSTSSKDYRWWVGLDRKWSSLTDGLEVDVSKTVCVLNHLSVRQTKADVTDAESSHRLATVTFLPRSLEMVFRLDAVIVCNWWLRSGVS